MARDTKPGTVNNIDRSPLHLLHRGEQCASDLFLAIMPIDGLTPRQFAVMTTISKYEGLSQTHLVERTGIDRSTIADITRRLLKRGLVARRRSREDARAYSVKLTDAGVRMLRAAEPVMKTVDETILAAIPASQRDRFVDDLNAIVVALSAKQDT